MTRLPPPGRPLLFPAVLSGFPAFAIAHFLRTRGFDEWARNLPNVHGGYRDDLQLALAALDVAAEQFRDLKASAGPVAVGGSAAAEDAAVAAGSVREVSTEEAAAMLGVTDNRVRQLCRAGELPARKVGSTWLVDAASVRVKAVA